MSANKIRRLPVVKQNTLVGILVASDLARQVGKKSIGEEIWEAIGRLPPGPLQLIIAPTGSVQSQIS